jgi:hypothetical protein
VLEDFFTALLVLIAVMIASFAVFAVAKLYQGQR